MRIILFESLITMRLVNNIVVYDKTCDIFCDIELKIRIPITKPPEFRWFLFGKIRNAANLG